MNSKNTLIIIAVVIVVIIGLFIWKGMGNNIDSEFTTTTTTTTLPGLVLGKSIIRIPSCSVDLTMAGINPLLSYLLCLGQNACKTCISPWLVLLLGLITTFGGAILAKKYHE